MYENNGNEFAIYTNVFMIEGEIIGGVHGTPEDALDEARGIISEMEGLDNAEAAGLNALNGAELEERLLVQDVVGYAQVAQRDVLFR